MKLTIFVVFALAAVSSVAFGRALNENTDGDFPAKDEFITQMAQAAVDYYNRKANDNMWVVGLSQVTTAYEINFNMRKSVRIFFNISDTDCTKMGDYEHKTCKLVHKNEGICNAIVSSQPWKSNIKVHQVNCEETSSEEEITMDFPAHDAFSAQMAQAAVNYYNARVNSATVVGVSQVLSVKTKVLPPAGRSADVVFIMSDTNCIKMGDYDLKTCKLVKGNERICSAIVSSLPWKSNIKVHQVKCTETILEEEFNMDFPADDAFSAQMAQEAVKYYNARVNNAKVVGVREVLFVKTKVLPPAGMSANIVFKMSDTNCIKMGDYDLKTCKLLNGNERICTANVSSQPWKSNIKVHQVKCTK